MDLKQEKELTFVLATHNLEMAKKADYIYQLAEGKVSPKSPQEL